MGCENSKTPRKPVHYRARGCVMRKKRELREPPKSIPASDEIKNVELINVVVQKLNGDTLLSEDFDKATKVSDILGHLRSLDSRTYYNLQFS